MGNQYWVTDPRARGGRLLVQTIEPTARQKKSATKRQNEFAKVPLQWATEVAKCTRTRRAMVWILLLHMAWKNKSTTFPLSNVMLARYGVDRKMKHRTLAMLEAAGQIGIEHRRNQAPIVTLLRVPK